MFQQMKKRIKNEKGLTLIELLAVIVILAIIAAIAIPAIGNIIENSRYNTGKSDAINVLSGANIYFTDTGAKIGDTVKVSKLKADGYLETEGTVDPDATITKAGGGNIIDGDMKYSGDKTVTLNKVTVQDITKDTQKGSDEPTTIDPVTP